MNTYLQIIQPEMALVEQELLSIVQSPVKLLSNIGEHLIKAGGKRLRPALYFLCAYDGAVKDKLVFEAKILPMAASLELIHMATLVHDDVIDNATSRRGEPTANVYWNNRNTILAGDYFLAKALSYITPSASKQEFNILTDMISELCEGEINQQYNAFNPQQSEADYEKRIFQKTANFISAVCELGALAGKYADVHIEALKQYGNYLGMAFQITDDILDIIATEEELGKPAGHDIGQGVVTLPVIRALETGAQCLKLKELISNHDISGEQIKEALDIIRSGDAVEYSYAKVSAYLEKARAVIPDILSGEVRTALLNITEFVEIRRK
ncbi:MAG: polyprenyl synthetase family protein [Sporomusaceae bacterium]|nr:polyprenyl synthetase family protein [Sporomusaceae bacterium]